MPDDYRQARQIVQPDPLAVREAAAWMGRSYEAAEKLCGCAVATRAGELDE